jgi:hypothetical protein
MGGGSGDSEKLQISILLAGLLPAKSLASLNDRELNIIYSTMYHELITNESIRDVLRKRTESVCAQFG